MRFWVLLAILCGALEAWHSLPFPTAGVLAAGQPDQQMLVPGEVKDWKYRNETFHPLARYSIRARILSSDSYYFDRPAEVSNLDLALGWDRMSDPRIYGQLNITQGGRWYEYHWWNQPPIPPAEIICSSANTHIIPADFGIRERLFWMREGDMVALSGYLVSVTWPDGGSWTSSLSRTDTGDHSCEVMWVNSAQRVGR